MSSVPNSAPDVELYVDWLLDQIPMDVALKREELVALLTVSIDQGLGLLASVAGAIATSLAAGVREGTDVGTVSIGENLTARVEMTVDLRLVALAAIVAVRSHDREQRHRAITPR